MSWLPCLTEAELLAGVDLLLGDFTFWGLSAFRIEYQNGNLHLPDLNLWLDPHQPITGPDKVFVSHAHSDHTAAHREVILSKPTSKLMQARVPGVRLEQALDFGDTRYFQDAGAAAFR